jgi:hypothetical protein
MPKIFAWPCWYVSLALLLSIYQGLRGAREHALGDYAKKLQSDLDRWVILYVHDFVFRAICSMAGFAALYACYTIATWDGMDWKALSAGSAALLTASFIVGVIGVGGQLHYVVLLGPERLKLPGEG